MGIGWYCLQLINVLCSFSLSPVSIYVNGCVAAKFIWLLAIVGINQHLLLSPQIKVDKKRAC